MDFLYLSIPPFQTAWNAVVGCDEDLSSGSEALVGSGFGSRESSPGLFFFALAYVPTMSIKASQTSTPLVSVDTCVGVWARACVVGLFDGAVVSKPAGIVAIFSLTTDPGS